MPFAVLMQPVERICRQLLGLTGIADQPQQRSHQPWVVFEKQSFEAAVGNAFRVVRQNQCFVYRLHTR